MADKTTWAICPVEDCTFALEYDPQENLFCPSCEMEMIWSCPSCDAAIQGEEQTLCYECQRSFKS